MMLHKQKAFYTPFWQREFKYPQNEKIINWIHELKDHEFSNPELYGTRTHDGNRKGYQSPIFRWEKKHAMSEHIDPLIDYITTLIKQQVDSNVKVLDYEFNISYYNTYHIISNHTTGQEKYNAIYILDLDEEYEQEMGHYENNGTYRLINPNTYAHPLYWEVHTTKHMLTVLPSRVLYEMLPYHGEKPRVALQINYIYHQEQEIMDNYA